MQTSISLISLLAPLCTDPQTVDGKVPAIPHYVLNFATTNLVGGWKQAIAPPMVGVKGKVCKIVQELDAGSQLVHVIMMVII